MDNVAIAIIVISVIGIIFLAWDAWSYMKTNDNGVGFEDEN